MIEALDLTGLDATALAESVRSREISARDLVAASLQRIERLDPTVNAFRVVMAREALEEADRIDARSDGDLATLALAGVPVAIKDDTDVAGQSTMWGTSVDRGVCTRDAVAVGRLRTAGAIVIGKTNVPELTMWPWTASATWGVTSNPWDSERTPGGSSGGSAAAVCTGMAAMALGSDGGGSVRYPAGLTGLIGVKPQRDRVPVGPEHGSGWHGLIVLGPLTRSVRDAALFLDLVSADPADTALRDGIAQPARVVRVAISTNPPAGSQVSLPSDRRSRIDEAAEVLRSLGHETIEVDIEYGLRALWNSTVRYLKGVQDDVASIPERSALEARTRAVARLGRLIPARSLTRALANEDRIAASINRVFETADVVLTPLCELGAPTLEACPKTGAIRSLRAANTSAWLIPWNLTGQPALTVPTGFDDDNLPVAIQLIGQPGDEATLLALAAQIETARPVSRYSMTPARDASAPIERLKP